MIGEADNAPEAVALVVDVRPDVVLMDLRLPGSSGVHAVEQLSRFAPASRVLILTRTEQNRVVEAIVAGASGYILKTAPPEAIIAAIRATAAGEAVISSKIAGKLLDHIRERDIPITAATHDAAGAIRAVLTPRELEIFTRLGQRQKQRRHRSRALGEHEHGLQSRRQHPRQAPRRQPHPGGCPSRAQRHLVTRPQAPR